jgi:multidrug efflux system membrane fusion protein
MTRFDPVIDWVRAHRSLATAGAAALVAILVYGRHETTASDVARGQGTAPRAVPVVTAAARTGDISVFLDGIGTVTPLATVTVHTRVDGQLMKVHFHEGQAVASGDLLAELDPRPFEVQLTQAQGQMARDQALLANAMVDVQRYRALVKDNAIPKQQLDTQESLVHQYEAAIEVDRGQVAAAELNLAYSRVTAPVGGRVGLRLVDEGNIVHTTDASGLAVVTQLRPIDVVFSLAEDHLPELMAKVRAGAPLAVDAFDREGTRHLARGTLLTIDNAVDPSTGTVRVKAEFPNDDDALFPNQFVNARLELDVRHGVTLVPEAAVQRGTQGTFVYLVGPDRTVEARPVALGVTEGDDASIERGVAPGDLVVVDGTEGLRPGTHVSLEADRASAADHREAS